MFLEEDRRKAKKIRMYHELKEIRSELSDIKNNDIHHIYIRLGKLETKTRISLSLLFIILGVLLAT